MSETSSPDFVTALRPFSLVVALATCSLGVTLAVQDGVSGTYAATALILAGVLLQAGVNLINDHADLNLKPHSEAARRAILRHYRSGWAAIALGCLIGLGFVWLRGWPMLALGVIGIVGAWSYAAGPLNFKARGLGWVAVFFLTGVLMIAGAYYALTGGLSLEVLWLSLPFSLFASLLLLANELRDYESDAAEGQRTFTVRFGYRAGAGLYRFLLAMLVAATWVLIPRAGLALTLLPLLALGLLLFPLRLLSRDAEQRAPLARLTGRCYFVYAVSFVGVLWVPQP